MYNLVKIPTSDGRPNILLNNRVPTIFLHFNNNKLLMKKKLILNL